MAKQLGRFKYEKTLGCITFYRRGDKWYARQKSSLSSRRVKTSKQFTNTMKSARRMGKAACIAGAVYNKLPDAWKMFELYQQLTGIAARLLKEGKSPSGIREVLEQQLHDWGYRKELQYSVIKPSGVKLKVRDFKVRPKYKVQGLRCLASKIKSKGVANDNVRESFAQRRGVRLKFKVQGLRCSASKFKNQSVAFSIIPDSFTRKRLGSQRRIRCKTGYYFNERLNANTS